jgi:hypothetical protein
MGFSTLRLLRLGVRFVFEAETRIHFASFAPWREIGLKAFRPVDCQVGAVFAVNTRVTQRRKVRKSR